MVTREQILDWLRLLAKVYSENRNYLTQLDSAIGDADHGANMTRGFEKVQEKIPTFADKTIDAIFKDVGMVLVSTVGGASGPLYGTFFMRAAAAVTGEEALTAEKVQALFEAGLEGIIQRGKAEAQDKTMIDAFAPAVEALKAAFAEGQDIAAALAKAVEAAEAGMKATIPLQARKGRASYLGERSIGHQDPGATSTYLMFKAAHETWKAGD
jgi:phosphoenolpyruvate---glycerone phosphotransferase subunit DhaL